MQDTIYMAQMKLTPQRVWLWHQAKGALLKLEPALNCKKVEFD